jgi:hypothetical protein
VSSNEQIGCRINDKKKAMEMEVSCDDPCNVMLSRLNVLIEEEDNGYRQSITLIT